MAVLGSLDILLIVIAGVVAVTLIVVSCSACCLLCCGCNNPLCCLAAGFLGWLGLRPRGYDEIGGRANRYGTVTTITTTTVGIPPPPSVVYSSSYVHPVAVQASAPPAAPQAHALPMATAVLDHEWQQPYGKAESASPPNAYQAEKGFQASAPPGPFVDASAPPLPSPDEAQRRTLDVPTPPKDTKPRDVWALALFVGNVVLLLFLAVRLGLPSLGLWERQLGGDVDQVRRKTGSDFQFSPEVVEASRNLLFVCLGLAAAGDLLAVAWLHLMLRWSTLLITSTIWSTILGASVLALLALTLGHVLGFLLFGALALAAFGLLRNERSRVFLSSANLGIACRALLDHPGLLGVAYLVLLCQLLWAALWTLAALGVYAYMAEAHEAGRSHRHGEHAILMVYLAVALYWGQQVLENVLRCTVVGTVASWWYTPEVAQPVLPALARAAGPSLGSVCCGSLLVSLVEGARAAVRGLAQSRRLSCLGGCLLDYLLAGVEGMWHLFNRFAFVFIGVWGYPYVEAAQLGVRLFESKGWQVVLNDYLIGETLFLGALLVGGLSSSLGVYITHLDPVAFAGLPHPAAFAATAGFFLGLFGCLVIVNVLSAAVDTIFVTFAADPGSLQRHRPAEYMHLLAAWRHYDEWHGGRRVGHALDEERLPINLNGAGMGGVGGGVGGRARVVRLSI